MASKSKLDFTVECISFVEVWVSCLEADEIVSQFCLFGFLLILNT